MQPIEALEASLVAQWSNFGNAPGGVFHSDESLTWTEAPVAQLPYNAVIRTSLRDDADSRIDEVIKSFAQRGVKFVWVVHPSSSPLDLADRLTARGLTLANVETGMALDLASWEPSTPLDEAAQFVEVRDEVALAQFEELTVEYWDLEEATRPWVHEVQRFGFARGDRGCFWLAYLDGEAVGKAFLSIGDLDDVASIWGVYVKPSARGHGIANRLTELAVDRAHALGRRMVVLASSEMARSVYARLGFETICELPVYASAGFPKALKGTQPI